MKATLKIDHNTQTIIMYKAFAKKAEYVNSKEYHLLQEVRRDYLGYGIVIREIKKNSQKECYKGLTYDYMRSYIQKYEPLKTRQTVLNEFEKYIDISRCHSKRYPVIKQWFLEKYPNIEQFGMPSLDCNEQTDNTQPKDHKDVA